jgi:hypothetical protein
MPPRPSPLKNEDLILRTPTTHALVPNKFDMCGFKTGVQLQTTRRKSSSFPKKVPGAHVRVCMREIGYAFSNDMQQSREARHGGKSTTKNKVIINSTTLGFFIYTYTLFTFFHKLQLLV